MEALLVTPVKDSLETTRRTINAVAGAAGNFEYLVFDDFSGQETHLFLKTNAETLRYSHISLADYTNSPSPNYKLILQIAREKAIEKRVPLIIIESDVIIRKESIKELISVSQKAVNPGLVGLVTVDEKGKFNFPYAYVKEESEAWSETKRSLSFCCTLLTHEFLTSYDFAKLPTHKDWFDIYISRMARRLKFRNYLIRENGVLHLPHSSRPWKQLKYTNPLKYYFFKLLHHRDKI